MTRRLLLVFALFVFSTAALFSAAPRVLPEGKLPNDGRLELPKDLDGYFPFTPPQSQGE